MSASPSFAQIRAQVSAVRRKLPNANAIGLRSAGRWTGDAIRADGESSYVIRQCDSPLAARMALREPAGDDAIRVLVTQLDDRELGNDVLVKLAKRRLIPIESWQVVATLFQASHVDPRLTAHPWIADALLELLPPGGYPPAPAGFLDAESVWPLLLKHQVGLSAEALDLVALLSWSAEGDAAERFRAASKDFRDAASGWIAERAGPAATAVLGYIQSTGASDAIAVGLAAGIVFHQDAAGRLEKASGRFEATYLPGTSSDLSVLSRWATGAIDTIGSPEFDKRRRRGQIARADEILREIDADSFAYLSDVSPRGFEMRLTRLADLIGDALRSPASALSATLNQTQQAIATHEEAKREGLRLERVNMALRLLRRLAAPAGAPESLPEAAAFHLSDGGFADWARFLLRSPEPVRELATAYAELFERTTAVREREAEWFASLLRDWTAANSPTDGLVPLERLLEEIVAPVAAVAPLLLVVVDGMSAAVYRELYADLEKKGWTSLSEPGRAGVRPGLAAVPSWTQASRTSLLCGQLMTGNARNERDGFAAHGALRGRCKNGHPPVLFHKAGLEGSEDSLLGEDVRSAIGNTEKRVVGVVVNAVDDHLLKGGQLEVRWSRDAVRVLPPLLHEARAAGRLVVLVSDHGHVLEAGSRERISEGGERWRNADGRPEPNEVLLEGPRVLVPGHRVIAPWSERVRYTVSKRNGYHGGASPQEMVIPVAILWGAETPPAGCVELPIETPAWWDEVGEASPLPAATVISRARPSKPRRTLFDEEVQVQPMVAAKHPKGVAEATQQHAWIAGLLASEAFAAQKRLGGRGIPADEVFAKLLSALDARGGKLLSPALARMLAVPPLRLRSLLAAAQRVLNVDGYPVLSRDEADDTVTFQRDLLIKQFDLI